MPLIRAKKKILEARRSSKKSRAPRAISGHLILLTCLRSALVVVRPRSARVAPACSHHSGHHPHVFPQPCAPCWPAGFLFGAGGCLPFWHGVGGFTTNSSSLSATTLTRLNSVKTKSRYFAGFCGLKHVPCMSKLLGIFVLGHYGALYIQNDENGVIFKMHNLITERTPAAP